MIIVAALIALAQLSAARGTRTSNLANLAADLFSIFELPVGTVVSELRTQAHDVALLPKLSRENAILRAENRKLSSDNSRMRDMLAGYSAQLALQPISDEYPRAIPSRVIGFPPENELHIVTIDRGTRSSVSRDDGVLSADGVVGRIIQVAPFTSKALLITDYASTIPAVVQRGHWWGIVKGNLTSLHLEYISQDAHLRLGDRVVTGEARSFHSGAVIGRIVKVERSDAGLYQTAVVRPAVEFGSLDRVVVVPK
ncbi:MAG: rod shape-determining protein MreC [Candidatus Eremiobacteraeota bacterium]|nr:rod shape-determining protein MreC [Candidatus Eremiobacteraeota bacterium]